MKKLVVGLGEILWDLLPTGKHLGGAPANFAYMTNLLGDQGVVASRVGNDRYGAEATRKMRDLGLSCSYLQHDSHNPTGIVNVKLDGKGGHHFEIEEPSAWDFFEWNAGWQALAAQADAVCFGSLAQRAPRSRETIRQFVSSTRPEAVRVFDVNLRGNFYSPEVIDYSMNLAGVVKMNHEEVPQVMQLCGLAAGDEPTSARRLMERYGLQLVCVTRGCKGSLLLNRERSCEQPGVPIEVADTVGAGDAFTAGMVHEYLDGSSLEAMGETANLVGAWVASQTGPTPLAPDGRLQVSTVKSQLQQRFAS